MNQTTFALEPAARVNSGGSGAALERFLQVLRRRWLLVLAFAVVLGLAGFLYGKTRHSQYTATSYLLFGPANLSNLNSQISGVTGGNPTPQQQSDTNVLLLLQGDAASLTAAKLGHGLDAAAVSNAVSVSPQGQSNGVSVAATAASPQRAAEIANTFADEFIASQQAAAKATLSRAEQLIKRQLSGLTRTQVAGPDGQALVQRQESLKILSSVENGNVTLVRQAGVPSHPSSPSASELALIGVLFGLVLGLAVAFLLERLDRRLKDTDELEEAFGYPILAHIPALGSYAQPRVGDGPVVLGEDAEAFRLLRAHLRYFNIDRQIKTIIATSIEPGDGKTTVSRNLAEAAASMGTRTLLLEADMRNPNLAVGLGLKRAPGLAESLVMHGEDILKNVQQVPVVSRMNGARSDTTLDVLVAGAVPPNPGELLESAQMQHLLAATADAYDLVIVDAPPITVVSDAIPLLRTIDGVLLVGRIDKNTRDSARRFHSILTSLDAPVLGVVVNAMKLRALGYGYGRYGYYKTAAEPDVIETSAQANGAATVTVPSSEAHPADGVQAQTSETAANGAAAAQAAAPGQDTGADALAPDLTPGNGSGTTEAESASDAVAPATAAQTAAVQEPKGKPLRERLGLRRKN